MLDSIKQKLEKLNPIESTSLKKAGVFIGILYHDEYINNPEIIFTQRSTKLSTHSGEVSFPGGKWDEQDKNLYQTALRESNEEINLNTEDVVLAGSLNYLVSKHKIEVNPYVGLRKDLLQFYVLKLNSLMSQPKLHPLYLNLFLHLILSALFDTNFCLAHPIYPQEN